MMREIKFRAWDDCAEKMVIAGLDDDYIFVKNESGFCVYSGSDGMEIYHLELMQSTGLVDKNGADIYEGDIVQLVDLGFGDLGQYEVEFNDESAGFVMYFNQEIRHFIDHYSEDEIEVIGDIYRNPELLEVVNE